MTDDQISSAEQDRRDDLATTARELKMEVTAIRGEVQNLRVRAERTDRRSVVNALLIAALILGAVWLGFVSYQTQTLSQQNRSTAERLEKLVQGAFCPLYDLFVGSYAPETRALNPDGSYTGSDREKYEEGFVEVRRQRAVLECKGEPIPKRIG